MLSEKDFLVVKLAEGEETFTKLKEEFKTDFFDDYVPFVMDYIMVRYGIRFRRREFDEGWSFEIYGWTKHLLDVDEDFLFAVVHYTRIVDGKFTSVPLKKISEAIKEGKVVDLTLEKLEDEFKLWLIPWKMYRAMCKALEKLKNSLDKTFNEEVEKAICQS